MSVDARVGEPPDGEPRTCSACQRPLADHTLRSLLVCQHGEREGNAIADRVAARFADPEYRRRVAVQGAKVIGGALEILKVIQDAPVEERPALIAHVKAELRRLRGA